MIKIFFRFCEEPYRIFFPLGILCGIFGIGHWFVYASGWAATYSTYMHASIQIETYMICFIAGFLMTALPRMSATKPASWIETCGLLILISSILVSLYSSRWIPAHLLFIASLVWLLFFGVRRLAPAGAQARVKPPVEFLWVPTALLHGILGSLLLITGISKITAAWAIMTGKSMVQQGLVLSIVLGIGGFLAPRLMGTFRIVEPAKGPCCEIKQEKDRRCRRSLHLAAGALLLISFFFEGFGFIRPAYGLRALIVTVLMIGTRSLVSKPLVTEQYVRLLWISLWMVALGSWAAFIFPSYRAAMLHIIFIGGYSLMTFAVATMVITSHAGKSERLKRPSKILSFLAVSLISAMCLRIAGAFFPSWYFQLLGLASFLWLAAAFLWFFRMMPLIFVLPRPEDITRLHEDAKQRVLKMREGAD